MAQERIDRLLEQNQLIQDEFIAEIPPKPAMLDVSIDSQRSFKSEKKPQ